MPSSAALSVPPADTAGRVENAPDRAALAAYAKPRLERSLLDVATSVVPYLALSVASYFALRVSVLLTLALAIPTAGFLLRTYIVFHDCTHGSLLPSRRANVWLGTVLGLLVWTPYRNWRRSHVAHHATAGDLDNRGGGDVPTITVAEYRARGRAGRLGYRLFRNPLVMFGLGPIWAMMIGPRLISRKDPARMRRSALATDVAIAVMVGLVCWAIGWQDWLLVWLPSAWLAGSIGVWLFYVQHQFEDAYWASSDDWSFIDAALQGSSFLDLPQPLRFFTANIGYHHVHHLNAAIPNYNLRRAHEDNAVFHSVPVMRIADGLRTVRFKLWDEQSGRLVGFAAASEPRPAAGATVTALSRPSFERAS